MSELKRRPPLKHSLEEILETTALLQATWELLRDGLTLEARTRLEARLDTLHWLFGNPNCFEGELAGIHDYRRRQGWTVREMVLYAYRRHQHARTQSPDDPSEEAPNS